MSLVSIWKSNRDDFVSKALNQIIAIAGDGKLSDDGVTSGEFRDYLRVISSDFLIKHVRECLEEKFESSGLALQDIINEIGERIGFKVTRGRYRGRRGVNGFDGLWMTDDSHGIVVEVKTTDAYAINLDTVAGYRKALVEEQCISQEKSSMLMVVGRQDTGGLEAQIRGSRQAWDMRVISVEALARLLELRESLDEPDTVKKISSILIPQEFTRLDAIVEIVFSATEDAVQAVEEEDGAIEEHDADSDTKHARRLRPSAFHDDCVRRVEAHLGQVYLRESKTLYLSEEKDSRLWVAVSRNHGDGAKEGYWFALHTHQIDAMSQLDKSQAVLGCDSAARIFVIPFNQLSRYVGQMWTSVVKGREYRHIKIEGVDGRYFMLLEKGYDNPDITEYLLEPGPQPIS